MSQITLKELYAKHDSAELDVLARFVIINTRMKFLTRLYGEEVLSSGNISDDWKARKESFLNTYKPFLGGALFIESAFGENKEAALSALYIVDYFTDKEEFMSSPEFNEKIRVKDSSSRVCLFIIDGLTQFSDVFKHDAISKAAMQNITIDTESILLQLHAAVMYTQFWRLQNKLDEADTKLKSYEKKFRKFNVRINKLQEKCDRLEKRPERVITKVITETKVDTEEIESYYQELQVLSNRVTLLQDKLAIYQATTTDEEFEIQELIYNEIMDSIDLSQYKIYIVGDDNVNSDYPFPYIVVNKEIKNLNKVMFANYVFVDIRHCSHSTYYTVKSFCKKNGIKMFHLNYRNKDAILNEVKRLIQT